MIFYNHIREREGIAAVANSVFVYSAARIASAALLYYMYTLSLWEVLIYTICANQR